MAQLPVITAPKSVPAATPAEPAELNRMARELADAIEGEVRFDLHNRMLYATDAYLTEMDATVREIRDGTVILDRTVFYATGGGAYAKLDNSFSSSNTANSFTLEGDDMAWGWQAGGGVEQKIGRNFSIGLEYLYSRYDDSDARVAVGTGTAGATNPFVLAGGADFRRSSDFDFHSLRATAAFRF